MTLCYNLFITIDLKLQCKLSGDSVISQSSGFSIELLAYNVTVSVDFILKLVQQAAENIPREKSKYVRKARQICIILCCKTPLSGVLTCRLGTTPLTGQGYTTCQPPCLTSFCHPGPSSSASFTQSFQFSEKLRGCSNCRMRPRRLSVIYSGG